MRDRREGVGNRGGCAREVSHHPRQFEQGAGIAHEEGGRGERAHVTVLIGHRGADNFVVNFVEHGANRDEWESARAGFGGDRGGFHVHRDGAGGFLGASLLGGGREHAMRRENRAARVNNPGERKRAAGGADVRVAERRRLFINPAVAINRQYAVR